MDNKEKQEGVIFHKLFRYSYRFDLIWIKRIKLTWPSYKLQAIHGTVFKENQFEKSYGNVLFVGRLSKCENETPHLLFYLCTT